MFERDPPATGLRPGPRETVALLAGLMALNAFAIDAMIPALPALGAELGVVAENDRQLVIVAYMLGFGATQLLWGPLADRFGRRPVLATGVTLYALFSTLCALAGSFPLLIAARIAQGAAASVSRTLVIAMVRDLYEGEEMARVMSLTFMVFMIVPVLAPSVGQLILLAGPWQAIFGVLALYGIVMLAWSLGRLPETLHPEYRRSLAWEDLASAARMTVLDRMSFGYTLAMATTIGALVAYIATIQQIVFDVFRRPEAIGLTFAAIAAPMALASWLNSRLVLRFGLRRVGHSGMLAFALVSGAHFAIATIWPENLTLFILLQALTMGAFAFTTSNVSTLAMERMGAIAGTASSIQGVVTTFGGAVIGFVIGQAFDGTQLPFLAGTAICAALSAMIVAATEPDRLFAGPARSESGRPA